MAVGQRPAGAANVDVFGLDVGASSAGAASKGGDVRGVLAVGGTLEVLKQHVLDLQGAGVVVAQSKVLLAVTLVYFDGVVHLLTVSSNWVPTNILIGTSGTYAVHSEILKHDVVDDSVTTTSLEVAAFCRWYIRPASVFVTCYRSVVLILDLGGYLTLLCERRSRRWS